MRLALTFLSLSLCSVFIPLASYAACTNPSASAGSIIFNSTYKVMQYCNGSNWINTGAVIPNAAQTGCTTPAAAAGGVIYNSPTGVVQFCNGSNWIDTACAATRQPKGYGCTGPTGKAGDIIYETTSNEAQFCDSTNWVAMGWSCASANRVIPPLTTMSAISATYGYNCAGIQSGNVTPQVATTCGNKISCTIAITNPAFGDPAYQCFKKFDVTYACSHVSMRVAGMEYGDTFNIACNGIYDVSATYGFNCTGVPSGNVTRVATNLCNGKTNCTFTPTNGNMEGDPKVGCFKKFAMDYSCPDGNTKRVSGDYNVAISASCP